MDSGQNKVVIATLYGYQMSKRIVPKTEIATDEHWAVMIRTLEELVIIDHTKKLKRNP